MKMPFTILLYGAATTCLLVSFHRDRGRTREAVRKAGRMLFGVLPHFLTIFLVSGMVLAAGNEETIKALVGRESGVLGLLLSAFTGAVALVPVLAVFPVVSQLLENGAGTAQMAVFISTLTTVGVMTIPLERRYLGLRTALLRNLLCFMAAFATSAALEAVLV